MASQEQLQQILANDSSSSSSSTSDESSSDEQQDVSMEDYEGQQQDTSMEDDDDDEGSQQDNAAAVVSFSEEGGKVAPTPTPPVAASMPAKMRIKLSLRMPHSPVAATEAAPSTTAPSPVPPPPVTEEDKDTSPSHLKQNDGVVPKIEEKAKDISSSSSTAKTTIDRKNVQDTTTTTTTISSNVKNNDDDTENDDDNDDDNDEEEVVVKATIVNSSDEAEADVANGDDAQIVHVEPLNKPVALPPPPPSTKATTTTTTSTSSSVRGRGTTTPSQTKKKTLPTSKPSLPLHARSVRLPPLSSPGMLIPPTSGVYRGDADLNGYTTPASVFDHCMSLAGYTTEARRTNPHRGSSVRRHVGDMFDSSVSFTLRFPPLVPKELWSLADDNTKVEDDSSKEDVTGETVKKDETSPTTNGQGPPVTTSNETVKKEELIMDKHDAAELLLRSLAPPTAEKQENGNANSDVSRKRRRPWQFSDMVPLSLTLPYPESYVQKRLRYVEQVKERERAIVVSQEANEKYENEKEQYTLTSTAKRTSDDLLPPPPVAPTPTTIPPIPEPPSPPRLSELKGRAAVDLEGLDESKHPIYLPKGHETFTAHLDPTCFDITNGRYFNLLANSIADPNFVGPNAPGIAGLNLAGGSGLATAYSSNVSSGGGSASTLSAAYYGSVGGGSSSTSGGGSSSKSTGNKSASKKSSSSGPAALKGAPSADVRSQDDVSHHGGPSPTSTSTGLKKLMEDGGDKAIEMKKTIIRAAVYACRVGKHGMSFVGPNGEVYPDVGKAFAAHAGVRPCARCKNNKQGAYHCRLRRKHKDLDHDGGNSPAMLQPLFEEPLEHLLLNTNSMEIS